MKIIFTYLLDNLIAILALIISIINSAYSILAYRRNIKISINEVKLINGIYFLNAIIENKSRLPITITNIEIISDNETINLCKWREYSDTIVIPIENGTDIQEDNYTDGFPISFSQLDAHDFKFKTSHIKKFKSKNLYINKIVLYTTRGKVIKKINRTF